jgi:N6-adenosine-specific RNA methylase IME4
MAEKKDKAAEAPAPDEDEATSLEAHPVTGEIVALPATLPGLIDRARMHLALAQTSAEVLQGLKAAKAARHLAQLIHAANETQAECLRLIVQAERRMVLEIDDGQERGEIAGRGNPDLVAGSENVRTADNWPATYKELGLDRRRVREWRVLASVPIEVLEEAICLALLESRAPTRQECLRAARAHLGELENARTANVQVDVPDGTYHTIVIDPPWPMKKIERDVRPNQVGFDYPTMDADQLAAFPLPDMAAPDCHLFLWTTHKFLPLALDLAEEWGFRYVCCFVWIKPGGFQPIGLPQYNCEFALYCRRGTPKFLTTKQFYCAFEAPRREHSRKPDYFYDMVRRVCAGPRIDVFSREPRDGFDQFGNQAEKFAGAAE